MNLKNFKKWLIDNELESNDLFEESLKCYSIEAFKAAYLYSYLGFMDLIKKTIIDYPRVPNAFSQKHLSKTQDEVYDLWRKQLIGINSQDAWEDNIFKIINEGLPYNIFQLKDYIRQEFQDKRNRRNVSAHNKNRDITEVTVEDLWDFINYSKPYLVINGSVELWKESFDKVIKFVEKKNHESEILNLYNDYCKLQEADKELIFDWILKKLKSSLDYIDDNSVECLNIFLKNIFYSNKSTEFEWIKDERIILFCSLIYDKFMYAIDKKIIQEFTYDNSNTFLNIAIPWATEQKICEFLTYIYSDKAIQEWWRIFKAIMATNHEFMIDEKIQDIIVSSELYKEILEELKNNSYSYKTSYSTKRQITDTFDYRSFQYYSEEVNILLLLAKNEKITGEDVIDLIVRCKRVIDMDYSNSNVANNYLSICLFFQQDKDLFEWLKSVEVQ
jgi:hypothetical protein